MSPLVFDVSGDKRSMQVFFAKILRLFFEKSHPDALKYLCGFCVLGGVLTYAILVLFSFETGF